MSGPGGDEVGRVSVRVVPDVSNFRDDVKRELERLRAEDLKIPVTLDLDKANLERQLRELDLKQINIPVNFDVENVRDDVARATTGLKADSIKIPAEIDEAGLQAELARINEQIDHLSTRKATPHVELLLASFEAQRREVEAAIAKLDTKRVGIPVEVKNAAQVVAELGSIEAAAEALGRNPVLLRFELNRAQLEGEIAAVEARLAELDNKVATPKVRAETAAARHELDRLRADLDVLDTKHAEVIVDMDVDTLGADAHIAEFVARQRLRTIHLDVDVDRDRLSTAFNAAAASVQRSFSGIGSVIGGTFSKISGYITDMGDSLDDASIGALRLTGRLVSVLAISEAIVLAGAGIAAAYGAVSTAIAAIPAVLGLVAGAAIPVMLGLDGIKKAAGTIKPELDKLKASVSATFEKGLTPVFQNLATVFPKVQSSINNVAQALVESAASFTKFITSARGVELINTIFNNTAQAIRNMQPGLLDITDAFLTLASQGNVFDALTGAVNTFGAQFKKNVTDQLTSGTLTKAFAGLKGLLNELARGFADLVKNGIELFAAAAPGVTSFLRDLTGFFNRFNWTSLGKSVGGVFEGLGQALRDVPPETLRDIEDAFQQVADTLKDPQVQDSLKTIVAGVGPAVRALDELTRVFLKIGEAISEALQWIDKANQKIKDLLDTWNHLGEDDKGNGILTSDAQWWQDLMDLWDKWIARIKQNWDDFVAWFTGRELPQTQSASLTSGNPFGDFKLPDLPTFDPIEAPKLGPGWDTLDDDVRAAIDAMTTSATQALAAFQAAVVAGMALAKAAFDFTGVGTSFGLAFQQMVGTATLGMAAIAQTIVDGMGLVRAAFNFESIGVSLGAAFLQMVGTVNLGMASLVAAVTAGMVLVNAAFNFAGINATLGVVFLQMIATVNLGMATLVAAVTAGMVLVNAAFNFANINLTLGLTFQQLIGTTTLGMVSLAAAVAAGMVLVNTAFNFANINLQFGLVFQQLIGTTTLGMASLALAVTAGMALVNAAFNFANINLQFGLVFQGLVGTATQGMAAIVAAVTAGMAAINAAIFGGLSGILGFWSGNWASMVGIVSGTFGAIIGAVAGGMASILGSIAQGYAQINADTNRNWDEMAAIVSRGIGRLPGIISSGLSSAVAAARGFIGQFGGVGRSLMEGLKTGIMAMAGPIATAAANVVRAALAAARAAGVVSSPSKAFMEIGGYFGEGLAIGMEKSAPRVELAAERMTNAAIDSAEKIGSAFSGGRFAGDLSGKVEHSFADLSDATSSNAAVVGQLRALRGDVSGMTPGDAAIVAQLRVLIAVLSERSSAVAGAQGSRTTAALGAF